MPGSESDGVLEGPRAFGKEQLNTLSRLTPHLSRALATTARLGMTEAFSRDLLAASEHLSSAPILIRPDGRVRITNEQAEQLLGDGLTIKDGALCAAAPNDQEGLDRLIASLLPSSQISGDSVFITRLSGKSPLVLQGAPVHPAGTPLSSDSGSRRAEACCSCMTSRRNGRDRSHGSCTEWG